DSLPADGGEGTNEQVCLLGEQQPNNGVWLNSKAGIANTLEKHLISHDSLPADGGEGANEQVRLLGEQQPDNGVWLNSDGVIIFSKNNKNIPIISHKSIKLKGNHNLENYMAAIAAVYDEVTLEDIRCVAKNFSGVEHRIEFVKKVNDVEYYNDSIASTPTRTILGALSIFDQKIILIAGGYDKNIPFDDLGEEIIKKVKTLILLGNTSEKIYRSVINAYGKSQKTADIVVSLEKKHTHYINIIKVSNMQAAVNCAHKIAVSGDIVVLSPACASFDLYENFEKRGNHFKQLVKTLGDGLN
ncbi:MAG: hypothetical protein LBR79_02475, partial [Oscillospiraceae bacterium]|nr:hypothetical protein [Oscillospiraceae bacterium]